MFRSILFNTITIITLIIFKQAVLAAPASSPVESNGIVVIPLTKHPSTSTNTTRSIHNVLKSHLASCTAKILRGLRSHGRNTGTLHPSAVNLTSSWKRDGLGAGIDLTNYGGEMWYGTVSIGSNPIRSFNVQIDTGSSDLFVPASNGDENCRSHRNLWNPSSSMSVKAPVPSFSLHFTDGERAEGKQYIDTVSIAGFNADKQTFGVATTYSPGLAAPGFPPDGILGLAFESLSQYPASPVFTTLVKQKKLPQSVFSLKLTSSGGELYIGGLRDELYIVSTLIYVPVPNTGFWELKIDNIKTNKKIVLRDVAAIIDTGARYIFGDSHQVLALHQSHGGKVYEDGFYTFPCNSFPTVTFTIGGKPFLIPAYVLRLDRVSANSPDCFSAIVAYDEDLGSWSIGTLFIERFYTIFDSGSEPPRLGFAKLARTSQT